MSIPTSDNRKLRMILKYLYVCYKSNEQVKRYKDGDYEVSSFTISSIDKKWQNKLEISSHFLGKFDFPDRELQYLLDRLIDEGRVETAFFFDHRYGDSSYKENKYAITAPGIRFLKRGGYVPLSNINRSDWFAY